MTLQVKTLLYFSLFSFLEDKTQASFDLIVLLSQEATRHPWLTSHTPTHGHTGTMASSLPSISLMVSGSQRGTLTRFLLINHLWQSISDRENPAFKFLQVSLYTQSSHLYLEPHQPSAANSSAGSK